MDSNYLFNYQENNFFRDVKITEEIPFSTKRQYAINYLTILALLNYSQSSFRKRCREFLPFILSKDFLSENPKLKSIFPYNEIKSSYIKSNLAFDRVKGEYDIHMIFEATYPEILRKTENPPLMLFSMGNSDLLSGRSIAVVGTRKASEDGVKRANRLAVLLTDLGYTVTSGLARGIDTAAHTGTIRYGGKTIAVIGTPLDQNYPSENDLLQKRIAESDLLISHYPFGHPVRPYNFPERNYVMSGISLGTIIVEAGETSGAVVQGRQCLGQGHVLFILKSVIENPNLRWPRKFLDAGAHMLESADSILDALKFIKKEMPECSSRSINQKVSSSDWMGPSRLRAS